MKKTGFYIIKDKFFEDMPDVMAILKKLKERMAGRHADDSL